MADLRTDYKDDVLNTEVNELRKYRMIQNEDGTVSFEDVTEYLQVGDSFGSADINETNAEIEEIKDNQEAKYQELENAIDTKVTNNFATKNAVLFTDPNGNVKASGTITTTELGYLNGVTSNIQTQLNDKAYKGIVAYSAINSISESGIYTITGTPMTLLHMTFDSNFMSQIICQADGSLRYRYKYSGTWKDWETLTKDSSLSSKSVNHATSADSVPWSGVTGKPTVPKYAGTSVRKISTETDGEISIPFSDVGITSRPSVVVATVQSQQGFAYYAFDSSTTYIRIIAYSRDANDNTWAPIPKGTNVRIGLIVYA